MLRQGRGQPNERMWRYGSRGSNVPRPTRPSPTLFSRTSSEGDCGSAAEISGLACPLKDMMYSPVLRTSERPGPQKMSMKAGRFSRYFRLARWRARGNREGDCLPWIGGGFVSHRTDRVGRRRQISPVNRPRFPAGSSIRYLVTSSIPGGQLLGSYGPCRASSLPWPRLLVAGPMTKSSSISRRALIAS
jgi:hypothetical protein